MNSSLFLFLALVCWIGWHILSPFFRSTKTDLNMLIDNAQDTQKILQQKRSELMLTLRDLDFDFETGKLSNEDYTSLRKKYEHETIEVLKQIDTEKALWEKFQANLNKEIGSL